MTVYGIQVQMCTTLYVKAKSADSATKKAKKFITNKTFEIVGPAISELDLDSKDLPKISFAPCMTGCRLWPNGHVSSVA